MTTMTTRTADQQALTDAETERAANGDRLSGDLVPVVLDGVRTTLDRTIAVDYLDMRPCDVCATLHTGEGEGVFRSYCAQQLLVCGDCVTERGAGVACHRDCWD